MVLSYRTIYPQNIAQFLIFYRTLSDGLTQMYLHGRLQWLSGEWVNNQVFYVLAFSYSVQYHLMFGAHKPGC